MASCGFARVHNGDNALSNALVAKEKGRAGDTRAASAVPINRERD
jgi:hypothetical protein